MPTIENGLRREMGFDRSLMAATDAQGQYRVSTRLPARAAVLHDSGWLDLQAGEQGPTPTLTLLPWAEVEGRLLREGKPLANQRVTLMPIYNRGAIESGDPRIFFRIYTATTDADGRYRFDRVIDGRFDLRITFSDDRPPARGRPPFINSGEFTSTLELKSGDHHVVNMGEGSRSVTPRVAYATNFVGEKIMPTAGSLYVSSSSSQKTGIGPDGRILMRPGTNPTSPTLDYLDPSAAPAAPQSLPLSNESLDAILAHMLK
jgi:hypothetical protein